MTKRLVLFCLLALLGIPGQASLGRREVARINLSHETVLCLETVDFRQARTLCLRLEHSREAGENRWHEIRLNSDQWQKFREAFSQATRLLSEGSLRPQKLGRYSDFDQGAGTTLSLEFPPHGKGLSLTLYRPDPFTGGAGQGVRKVTTLLELPAAQQLVEQFAQTDLALKTGPAPGLPALTGPWKLKEVKVVNHAEGPGHFRVVRADAQAGWVKVEGWSLGWSFDQPVTTLQPNQRVKVSMSNQGTGPYGPNYPTMVLCLLTETQTETPLGDAYPDYRQPDPMPIYGFQYRPKNSNPGVQPSWIFTHQSRTLYPRKDETSKDKQDVRRGTMLLQMNPSGYPYAMFYFSARTPRPGGGISVCYLFERS